MKNTYYLILKFTQLPRKLIAKILRFLFSKRNLEATLIWLLIITAVMFMNTEDLTAYQTETYNVDENGEEVLSFNVEVQDTHWKLSKQTFFTSYNPERGQTDSSPCIGANGTNVCQMYKDGIRTIALSQDMVGRAKWKKYHYGDMVQLYSDNPQCNGVFQIEDTMNKRYTNRGDIFCLDRSCNTSCNAVITKL